MAASLPNAARAVVDLEKLRAYCLAVDHPTGAPKAAGFRLKLGWQADDAEMLREILQLVVVVADATFIRWDEFGSRYATDFTVVTAGGVASIRAAWIVRTNEDFPRLTTCHII